MKKWRFIALSSCTALLFGADPAGGRPVQVLEQNYRNDPISQEHLLDLYTGKTIDFTTGGNNVVSGKIIRSGYVSPAWRVMSPYQPYQQNGQSQPVIEVNGKLQFSLPGQPIFPALGDDTILKPALDWILYSPQAAKFDAELSYISGCLSWTSDYNVIAPENGDAMDLVGWVTLDNRSGKQFDHARIKLMAGDVNKVLPQTQMVMLRPAW